MPSVPICEATGTEPAITLSLSDAVFLMRCSPTWIPMQFCPPTVWVNQTVKVLVNPNLKERIPAQHTPFSYAGYHDVEERHVPKIAGTAYFLSAIAFVDFPNKFRKCTSWAPPMTTPHAWQTHQLQDFLRDERSLAPFYAYFAEPQASIELEMLLGSDAWRNAPRKQRDR